MIGCLKDMVGRISFCSFLTLFLLNNHQQYYLDPIDLFALPYAIYYGQACRSGES